MLDHVTIELDSDPINNTLFRTRSAAESLTLTATTHLEAGNITTLDLFHNFKALEVATL